MKFCVLTLGCKANQAESLAIERTLLERSFCKVELDEAPDICIINTCSVTAKSDYQSRQLIRRALRTQAKVYLTGCYSQLNQGEAGSLGKGVEIVKNGDKENFFNAFEGIVQLKESDALGVNGRSRALVKVQDGCNAACTYCIIPRSRGASVSRPVREVVEEVAAWEEAGYNEAILTGIHIGYYGRDIGLGVDLAGLVRAILSGTRAIRLRLTSLEVTEITGAILELLEEERICKHLHVPLQSGDDRILAAMNRFYDRAGFAQQVTALYDRIDNVCIGTDVIVGFPGEDDESFRSGRQFIADLPLAYLHVFPYSPRPHTKASCLPGQVDEGVKKIRARQLRELSEELKTAYLARQRGRRLTAVVETINGNKGIATTDNYLKAAFPVPENRNGKGKEIFKKSIVSLLVTGYENGLLLAKPIIAG